MSIFIGPGILDEVIDEKLYTSPFRSRKDFIYRIIYQYVYNI